MKRIAIIGAGISGLATAYAIERRAAATGIEVETLVLEKGDRPGGKILSVQAEGYTCEWGPNGFLDNKPMTLELCNSLGIKDRLLRSNDNARKRFIYATGELHRLPENGPSFFSSRLISWPGKIRLACELFVSPRTDGADETLADFARRRLGPEALDKLIGPMVSGIFAGNPETMSLRSCFPRINELEQQYGGLIKAMLKLARKKAREKKEGKAVASAAGPGGVLTSFNAGIQQLTDECVKGITGEIRTGKGVEAISVKDGGYSLRLTGGETLEADLVVSAAPAHALGAMLAGMDQEASALLTGIAYAPMLVVCFGYSKDQIQCDLEGFGYLVAKSEGANILGTLWDSSMFPHRAPEGKVLLRSMMGGAAHPEVMKLSDDEVVQKVKSDLKTIMGVDTTPEFIRVFRHERAIPQYVSGHADRLEALNARIENFPGFFVTGNAFGGVGINDCVGTANLAADRVMTFLADARRA